MVECTIFIKSVIKEWTYLRDLKLSSASDNPATRTLCLDGEVEYNGFIERQLFRCLVHCCRDSSTEGNVVSCLELHKVSLGEPEIPAHASLELMVSHEEFTDLKDCLMRSIGHGHAYVSVNFYLQGVQQDRIRKSGDAWIGGHIIKRINGKPLNVTGFGWELHCGVN